MGILILTNDILEAKRITAVLDSNLTFQVRGNAEEVDLIRFSAIIVALADCRSKFSLEVFSRLSSAGVAPCSVVLTRFSVDNFEPLRDKWRGQVIWAHEFETLLGPWIRKTLGADIRNRVHELLLWAFDTRDGPVSAVLEAAFLGPLPPTNHRRLAVDACLSERRLRQVLRQVGLTGRSERLVDWALLAWAVREMDRGKSLNEVSYCLGIEPWRIQRAATRAVGISAGSLSSETLLDAVRKAMKAG